MTTTEPAVDESNDDKQMKRFAKNLVHNDKLRRDKAVTVVTKFLQNQKVRNTSLAKKQAFLRDKGLTEVEIDAACREGGAYKDDQAITLAENSNSAVAAPGYQSTRTSSLLLKAMDVANMIALISIGSYSLYSLWKNYIAPRIFGTRSRLEQKYERLLEAITQLNKNVVELRELFKDIQIQSFSGPSRSSDMQDVKKEIVAIKTMLLGRSQFPSPSTGIPSWQMVGQEGTIESSSDEREHGHDGSAKGGSSRLPRNLSEIDVEAEPVDVLGAPNPSRRHPSMDSNNGFQSESSSCEIVQLSKTDSSDADHSD